MHCASPKYNINVYRALDNLSLSPRCRHRLYSGENMGTSLARYIPLWELALEQMGEYSDEDLDSSPSHIGREQKRERRNRVR